MKLPSTSEVVVIGAGVLGASTAFHLTRLRREVVLLDRGPLAAETSSQGAGFLCAVRPTAASTKIVAHSTRFYARFAEETGYEVDLHLHGGLRVAFSDMWLDYLRSELRAGKAEGVEVHEIGPAEIASLAPALDLSSAVGGTFVPGEGYVTATRDIGIGFARASARSGALVATEVEVTSILPDGNGLKLVTSAGEISARKVVLAANAGAWPLCRNMGRIYPSFPLLHECAVYDLPKAVPSSMPTVRLGERDLYIRHEGAGLMIGGVGHTPLGPDPDAPAQSFTQRGIDIGAGEVGDARMRASPYAPGIEDAICFRIQRGLAMVAPDLEPVAGEWSPGLYVMSADLRGVQSAPALGQMMAELVAVGRSEFDHRAFDPHRFDSIGNARELYEAARNGLRPRAALR